MGLWTDMYLEGQKYFWSNHADPTKNRTEDNLRVTTMNVELGYWRKHPNLHGYIMNTFADGKDACQQIELSANNLRRIVAIVEARELPTTTGFFFGKSSCDAAEIADDIAQLKRAIEWIETKEAGVSRAVIYKAFW